MHGREWNTRLIALGNAISIDGAHTKHHCRNLMTFESEHAKILTAHYWLNFNHILGPKGFLKRRHDPHGKRGIVIGLRGRFSFADLHDWRAIRWHSGFERNTLCNAIKRGQDALPHLFLVRTHSDFEPNFIRDNIALCATVNGADRYNGWVQRRVL